jgi:hypothetical protein
MVTFGEIERKDIRIPFKKDDIEGYIVTGVANFDKDDKLTHGKGDIRDIEGVRIASVTFNNVRNESRVSIGSCLAEKMNEAVDIAEATLADLALGYVME